MLPKESVRGRRLHVKYHRRPLNHPHIDRSAGGVHDSSFAAQEFIARIRDAILKALWYADSQQRIVTREVDMVRLLDVSRWT